MLARRSRRRSINGRVALSEAQPPELLLQAFEQVGEAVVAGQACEVDPATGVLLGKQGKQDTPGLLRGEPTHPPFVIGSVLS